MSRDPNEPGPFDSNGNPVDPKKLHKYLYAGGDPVNMIDPRGREEEEGYGFLYTEIGATTEEIHKFIAGPVLLVPFVHMSGLHAADLHKLGLPQEIWPRKVRSDHALTDSTGNRCGGDSPAQFGALLISVGITSGTMMSWCDSKPASIGEE